MVWRTLVVSVLAFLSVISVSTENNASALSVCANTEVVGVRGSGQLYGGSNELETIKENLPGFTSFTELENKISFLNSEPKYAAVKVHGDLISDGIGSEAVVTRSIFGVYRDSVDTGKNLLKKYIEHYQSTDTCLVLVGYSQGAQVIGETVRDMHKTDPLSLKNVIYMGLLGDPQFSPYGFDSTRIPTWLRGSALYPFTGVLGARQPDYIPRNPVNQNYPFTKIGSWCNYGDVICATDVTHYGAMRDGHASYLEEGIPEMVDEIQAAIANPDQNITGAIYPSSVCGAAKQDLVVLLDVSAYMRRNKDLFTKDKNNWDTKRVPGTNQSMFRTFGEQLLDSGCGDGKRVAIVGFEGPHALPPRVLLDFTARAQDIDNLMDSLYAPSSGGVAERPQLREAAILGMQQNWRSDASRTLLALTALAGDGPAPTVLNRYETWSSPSVIDQHMGDAIGQQLLVLSRKTRAAIITSPYLPISLSGFSVLPSGPGSEKITDYVQVLTKLTGGYNWDKRFSPYATFATVKNVDFSSEIQQFEKRRDGTRVAMGSIKAKVGQPVTLTLDDTKNLLASAGVRGHGTATEWYLDCDGLHKRATFPTVQEQNGVINFTPAKAGSCTGAVQVRVQGSGNGCYSGCPEPFPPYMLKTVPFQLEVLPAGYIEKVPGNITALTKTIYDDRVEFSWRAPTYIGTEGPIYLIKDEDGSVLAATTENRAVVTGTDKQDINVLVQAVGADGRSEDLVTADARIEVDDLRTMPDQEPATPSQSPANDIDLENGTLSVAPNAASADADQAVSSLDESQIVAAQLQGSGGALEPTGKTLGDTVESTVEVPLEIPADAAVKSSISHLFSMKWLWLIPIGVTILGGISRINTRKNLY